MGRNYLLVKVLKSACDYRILRIIVKYVDGFYSYSPEVVTKPGPHFVSLIQTTPCALGSLKLGIFVAVVKFLRKNPRFFRAGKMMTPAELVL